MEYALRRREGFIMITGKPGTGKTTLINDLLNNLPTENLVTARLDSIHLESEELLRMVAFSFGLEGEKLDKTTLLRNMTQFLTEKSKEGKKGLLIVDEGQALSSSALEELRLLSNLQDSEGPLLQVFLVGQEGLMDVMRSPSMAQLHQRLIAACHLDPLAADQTEAYIKHRLRTVGWKGDPELRNEIFSLIHKFSLGIPRRINLICSRLLLSGYVHEKHILGIEDVQHSIEDLREEKLTFSDDELAAKADQPSPQASMELSSNAVMESIKPRRFGIKGLRDSRSNRFESLGSQTSFLQLGDKGRVVAFVSLMAVASLTLILALYLSFRGTEDEASVALDGEKRGEQVVASRDVGEIQEKSPEEPAALEINEDEERRLTQQANELEQWKIGEQQVLDKPERVQKDQSVSDEEPSVDQGEKTALDFPLPQQPKDVSDEHERLVVLSMDQSQQKSLTQEEIDLPLVSETNASADKRLESPVSLNEQPDVNKLEENQEIKKLLTLAMRQRRYFKMTIPAGDNAYETYRKVLELDPNNQEAKAGLTDLVEFYRRRAVSYKEEGSYELSLEFIQRGLKVKPSNTELIALREQIETNRNQ